MYIFASFEQSVFLELAITELEQKGIFKSKIMAVPLNSRMKERQLFDTIHRADGLSLFDLAAILATCFMLLGVIYGFVLTLGPILWGLIGFVSGLLLGFIIKLAVVFTKGSVRNKNRKASEVVVVVKCHEEQADLVEKILWENTALGVAKA